jgi:uncharacterized protein
MTLVDPQPGSVALITGASSGIGRELARQLAARGHDTILVARRRDRLEQLATELRAEHGGQRSEVIVCDVSDPAERARLVAEVGELGVTVDVLVLCAGFGMGGPFRAQDPDRLQLLLRTNIESTVGLAHAFTSGMASRRHGSVLIVSSMAGAQPMPNFGVYAASKAAVTSFAESLHEELRTEGVTVTALCPGGVTTEFSEVADMTRAEQRMPRALIASPRDTAAAGLAALAEGRRMVVPGRAVRALVFSGRHLPRGLWLRACRRLMA